MLSAMKPWSLAIAVLLALAVAGHALEGYQKKISACPPKRGYTTLPNTDFVFGPVAAAGRKTHGSVSAAEAACTQDSSCLGFTFSGSSAASGSVTGFASVPGKCSYIKKRCPLKSGYSAFYNAVWTTDAGASEQVAASAEAAQAACDADDLCGGFNSLGKWVVGTVTGRAPALTAVCTYIKDTCPPKYGYTAYPNTALAGVSGEDGIAAGQLPSRTDAEEFCRLEYRCSAYSSDGSYFIGGVAEAVPSPGICSYIKNPCPPMAGFTAFTDSTLAKQTYAERKSMNCLADVYKACLEDSACKAFTNMRYVWNNLPSKANLESELVDAVGVCMYVKIEETLEGSPDV